VLHYIWEHSFLQGQEVGKVDFNTRLVCIEKEIIGARHTAIMQGLFDKTKEPFSVRIKPFWDVSVCRKVSSDF
jgi:mRNA-capping enzyme